MALFDGHALADGIPKAERGGQVESPVGIATKEDHRVGVENAADALQQSVQGRIFHGHEMNTR
jgi:hypothetical protein